MELTVKQVAPLLDMTPNQVRRLIRSHRLSGRKVGNLWIVDREDVVALLKEGLPPPVPQRHDRTYRHLFSHPEVIVDLLRGFFDEPWVQELDLTTLEKVSEGFVSHRLDARFADMVWKVKWRDRDLHVCLLLEFQSTLEPFMAVRWLPILGAFYQDQLRQLAENGALLTELLIMPGENSKIQDRAARYRVLPLVLPIVIYNGKPTWWPPLELEELIAYPPGMEKRLPLSLRYSLLDLGRVPKGRLQGLGQNLVAALVRLETSDPRKDLWQEVESIGTWLPEHLRSSFELWLQATLQTQGLELPEDRRFRRSGTMLAETLGEWKDELKAEGRVEGRVEGRAEVVLRQAELKFGPLDDASRRRIETADEEALLRCADRILTARRVAELF